MGFIGDAIVGLIAGYVFGSFPTGYLIGRIHGVDVRQHGSGRTGGSNVLRTVGWFAFALTILGDALKGIIPLLLVMHVFAPGSHTAAAGAVLGALVGSNWSIVIAWLGRDRSSSQQAANSFESIKNILAKAKGGAGVITTACAALTLYWPAVVPLIFVGLAVLIFIRYASIASVTVSLLYPIVMLYFFLSGGVPAVYVAMSIIAAGIVIYVLIPNLKRLRAGTEQKFGQRLPLS